MLYFYSNKVFKFAGNRSKSPRKSVFPDLAMFEWFAQVPVEKARHMRSKMHYCAVFRWATPQAFSSTDAASMLLPLVWMVWLALA